MVFRGLIAALCVPMLSHGVALAATGEGLAKLPAAPVQAQGVRDWPLTGRIAYRVFLGNGGLQVGEARHEWSHDARRYSMQVTLQTTGLAALLHGFHYVQRSEGEVGAEGLRPQRFTVTQQGKKDESALFDWSQGRVSIRRGERERRNAALQSGDQDVLSLWHQLGIVGASALPRNITVVSNKSATPAVLEPVGRERLRLPIGEMETLRVRARAENGALTIDIWLARDRDMLPVRIRMVDNKGEVLDQQAFELNLASAPAVDARPARAGADHEHPTAPSTVLARSSTK